MSRNLLIVVSFIFWIPTKAIAQEPGPIFTPIDANLAPVDLASASWGDYDQDGDLDILLNGFAARGADAWIYRNDGGIFFNISDSTGSSYGGNVSWVDLDNDGDLDTHTNGLNFFLGTISTLSANLGDGSFEPLDANLPGPFAGDVEWGDYDNDGDLDVLMVGDFQNAPGAKGTDITITNRVPRTRLFRNEGDFSFTEVDTNLPLVELSAASWGDYDNDGDLDILLAGILNNGTRISSIYKNEDTESFVDIQAPLVGVDQAEVAWGDYDNDGDLDAFISGQSSTFDPVSKLYRNDGNDQFVDSDASLESVFNVDMNWGDYDNDGDLDILIVCKDITFGKLIRIYKNEEGLFIPLNVELEGASAGTVAWGDYDNDGDLDLVFSGEDANGNRYTEVYRNEEQSFNTAPDLPSGLSAIQRNNDVTFSWEAGSDSQTPEAGLSYNLRVGTSPNGHEIMPAMSMGDGYRSIVDRGNTEHNTTWTLKNLEPGTYFWSVQTVDGGYVGSPFAPEQSFTVEEPAAGLELSVETISFGEVVIDRTVVRTVDIVSAGTVDLQIDAITIAGPDASAFSIFPPVTGPLNIEPAQQSTITIQFNPTDEGEHIATLNIFSNTPDREVQLGGFGQTIQVVSTEPPEPPVVENTVDLQATISDGYDPFLHILHFRRTGTNQYNSTPMMRINNTDFSAQIPPQFVTPSGVDYYMQFHDDVTPAFFRSPSDPAHLRVRVPELTAPDVFLPRTFRMFSVPLDLDDKSLDNSVVDDFGRFEAGSTWNLLRWNPLAEEGTGAYAQYGDADWSVSPGTGFWLVTEEGTGFSVENGLSVDAAQPQAIPLEPGWNQIGNPYFFEISWDQVSTEPRTTNISGPVLYDPDGPADDPYDYTPNTLVPWQGYFVRNNSLEVVNLVVDPRAPIEDDGSSPGLAFQEESTYWVQLSASIEENGLSDTQNYVGLAENALETYDLLDVYEAPNIGSYVRLSVVENDEAFAGNFKPLRGQGQAWDVDVTAVLEDEPFPRRKTVNVTLQEHGVRPENMELFVLDKEAGYALPIAGNSFEVEISRDAPVRAFRLIVGTEEFARERNEGAPLKPLENRLEQNYPNPFNPETQIRFQIGQPQHVTLDVFDLLGRRVRRLIDAPRPAGAHQIVWDARDDAGLPAPSGLYLYRIQAGAFTATQKMTLLR